MGFREGQRFLKLFLKEKQQYAHERTRPAHNATGIAAAFSFRKTIQRQEQGTRIEGKNRAIGAFFPVRQGFGV
jgi:hypothetical protein